MPVRTIGSVGAREARPPFQDDQRVRLELLSPSSPQNPGTPVGGDGVATDDRPAPELRRAPARAWQAWLLALAVCSLLGQGERCVVDPRLRSPGATLRTYWEALREGDAINAWDCLVEGRRDLPAPGMLWVLPATDDLWLAGFRSLPVSAGRVMVTYEVHFRASGSSDERMFRTGSELVRTRGEWRIAQPIGAASMPDWKPVPSPVDI